MGEAAKVRGKWTTSWHSSPPLSPVVRAEDEQLALAARLADEMAASWANGLRPLAEEFLTRGPSLLASSAEGALVIIREEIRLRREAGVPVTAGEVISRFPQWQASLLPLVVAPPSRPVEPAGPVFPKVGETFADCQLSAELGRGVQGRVYLATQPDLAHRPVVLKVTSRDGREHLALARLLHTHIVPLYFARDFPEQNLRALCMPFLGGATWGQLRDALQPIHFAERTGAHLIEALDRVQARLLWKPPDAGPARALLARSTYTDAVCWLGACLADALQFAHERHYVHLDLKPDNVLLAGDGLPLLLDFHLAREPLKPGDPQPEWFGGTDFYMAPEQEQTFDALCQGRPIPAEVDGRADVYGLGMVLCEMLGGIPARASKERLGGLTRNNPRVSHGLADILAKCVARDPARRYRQAGDLAADLRLHLSNYPLQGVPNRSLQERWRKWRRRNPNALLRAGLALLACAAVAASLIFGGLYLDGQRRDADQALADSRDLLSRGLPEQAEKALNRGHGEASYLFWNPRLTAAFEDVRHEARAVRTARELGRLADDLRFHWDLEHVSPGSRAGLEERCQQLWERRQDLLWKAALSEKVAADLAEMVILWGDLRVRTAAPPNKDDARRQALALLETASGETGTKGPLQREVHRLRRALGETFDRTLSDLPARTAWEHYVQGRALLRAGECSRARADLEAAVQLQPDGFWANFYHGVCAYRLNAFEEAAQAFRVCVALAPEKAPCYHNRGLALAASGRGEAARQDFDRALQLDPTFGPAWMSRGLLNYQEKRNDQAIDDLREALGRGGEPPKVHYNLALAYHAKQDRISAAFHLRKTLEYAPDHAKATGLLARIGK